LVVACVGVSLLAATIYNYTTRPLYRAQTQILIDPRTPNVLPGQEVLRDDFGRSFLNTQLHLLRGRHLAERVVATLELHRNPEFLKGPLLTPWERLRRRFLGSDTSPDDSAKPLAPAVRVFQSRVSVESVPNSHIVYIRFVAYEARTAAAAANALAEAFVEQSVTLRYTSSSDATTWLRRPGCRSGWPTSARGSRRRKGPFSDTRTPSACPTSTSGGSWSSRSSQPSTRR
jgi:uncharacterized protein involved in exopolysaccharide biosynthesis